jgi:hypothetical protein
MSTIADEARLSRRSVMRALDDLESRGAIEVTRERNHVNRYWVADITVGADISTTAKGTRKPTRKWSDETLRRRSASDSESPPRAVSASMRDSESLGRDSESHTRVTPSHPNKTKKNKTNEQDLTSALKRAPELKVSFDAATEDRATDQQVQYCRDVYIHLTGNIPTDRHEQAWRSNTSAQATAFINTCLKQMPRHDEYVGPERGTPAYLALSPVGQEWAERGMIPDFAA